MARATSGDSVQIHYTGRLEDGTVFDSSRDRDPLRFTLGEGEVIAGFEEVVEGMEEGETKTAEIPAKEAYGARQEDLILNVPRERIPEDVELEVGNVLAMRTGDGETFQVVIADVEPEAVLLDANHPLAGRDLTFEIELVAVG